MLETLAWFVIEVIGDSVAGPTLEGTGSVVVAALSLGRVRCEGVWAMAIGAAFWAAVIVLALRAVAG